MYLPTYLPTTLPVAVVAATGFANASSPLSSSSSPSSSKRNFNLFFLSAGTDDKEEEEEDGVAAGTTVGALETGLEARRSSESLSSSSNMDFFLPATGAPARQAPTETQIALSKRKEDLLRIRKVGENLCHPEQKTKKKVVGRTKGCRCRHPQRDSRIEMVC